MSYIKVPYKVKSKALKHRLQHYHLVIYDTLLFYLFNYPLDILTTDFNQKI